MKKLILWLTLSVFLLGVGYFLNHFYEKRVNQRIIEENIVTLDEETVALFEKGIIKGIVNPSEGQRFTMKTVREEWGEPDDTADHQDFQMHTYVKKGLRVTYDENIEDDRIHACYVEMKMERKEILKRMGDPYKEKDDNLIFKKGDYVIEFSNFPRDSKQWSMSLHPNY
ncbi:hypothetical protein [Bacillus marasmi]|uniref:hypothetical protein n=1 Tax=Bacillus marasmi TaxID=1926279 RepID=UPI0011C81DF4|nr:hypothetical protein [Bacillus marasmi]